MEKCLSLDLVVESHSTGGESTEIKCTTTTTTTTIVSNGIECAILVLFPRVSTT